MYLFVWMLLWCDRVGQGTVKGGSLCVVGVHVGSVVSLSFSCAGRHAAVRLLTYRCLSFSVVVGLLVCWFVCLSACLFVCAVLLCLSDVLCGVCVLCKMSS